MNVQSKLSKLACNYLQSAHFWRFFFAPHNSVNFRLIQPQPKQLPLRHEKEQSRDGIRTHPPHLRRFRTRFFFQFYFFEIPSQDPAVTGVFAKSKISKTEIIFSFLK
jgi:hypothetical protein